MVDNSKSKLLVIEYSVIVYLILFLFNLVYMNIMITRPDDIYLSDLLLWIHIILMIGFYIYIKLFQKRKEVVFIIHIYKRFLLMTLLLHIVYFISVYLQSYILIDDTLIIIRDKILRGNPALILDFSSYNYTVLSYVVSLLQSVNSPLILLFMSLWTMRLYYQASTIQVIEQPLKKYDSFLYKLMVPILWFLLMISSFLSINLLSITYSFVQSLEMFLGILLFVFSTVGYLTSYHWYKHKDKPSSIANMTLSHRFLFHLIKPIFVLLIGLMLFHVLTGFLSYRIYSVSASLAFILLLLLYHYRLTKLD